MKPVLKITTKRGRLEIEVLRPKRLTVHGFGMFLEDAVSGEIAMDDAARDILQHATYRPGVNGIEFWDKIFSFCDLRVPTSSISNNCKKKPKYF